MKINIFNLFTLKISFDWHIGYKNNLEKEVCEVYQNLSHIPAIKYYKKETEAELKESKEAVDEILKKYGLKE